MKYKFEDSKYSQLFENDSRFLQTFVDNAAMLRTNFTFWENVMDIAPNATPTAPDGTATFTVAAVESKPLQMADMRAPLGDSAPVDKEGIEAYSATIPDFITPGFTEKATEREYKERLYAQFGRDTDMVLRMIDEMQKQKDSADQTMSYMSAQLMSYGRLIYDKGRGIQSPLQKPPKVEENKQTAGASAWAAPDCKILDQMVLKQIEANDVRGNEVAWSWDIPYDMFMNVFLKNAQVKEWINYMYNMNKNSAYNYDIITPAIFNELVPLYPGLAPIKLVAEKQFDGDWNGGITTTKGWKEGIAVLRPSGKAGLIQHTDNLDQYMFQKYGNNIVQKSFAKINPIYTIVNTTLANGNYKEWHTDLMFSAVPTLTEFPDHIIVDTTTAD